MIQGNAISLSEEIQKQLTKKRFELIRGMFNSMSPFDIASALESSSPNNRRILWELVDISVEGEVLNESSEAEDIVLIEIDTDKVERVRKRGIKGLGQPLKSFRDNSEPFTKRTTNSKYLKELGVLEIPEKE